MNFAKLLLDPRGAIGRDGFGVALIALTGTIVLVLVVLGLGALALSWPVGDLAAAVTPVVGTSSLVATIVEAVLDDSASPLLIPAVLLMGVRFYALACMGLKRLRDAGRGPTWLIVVGAVSLAFHVQMGRWAYKIWASEIGTIIPPFLDISFNLLLWVVFLGWLAALPSRPKRTA